MIWRNKTKKNITSDFFEGSETKSNRHHNLQFTLFYNDFCKKKEIGNMGFEGNEAKTKKKKKKKQLKEKIPITKKL